MKKTLLFLLICVCSINLSAQTTIWQDENPLPREFKDNKIKDIVAVSPTNEVYVTGIFDKDFTFGKTTLSPIATSTYLVKYAADGKKQWAVSFAGAVTPTAITVDKSNGNVYVAGTLADVVVLGSTDNNTKEIEGVKDDGKYIVNQSAAFIAQYSANGILQKVEVYKPTALDEMDADYSKDGIGLVVNSLIKAKEDLYASILIRGKYIYNDIQMLGGKYLAFGFLPLDTRSGYLVSFDDNLSLKKSIANLAIAEDQEVDYQVKNISFTLDDNTIYLGFVGSGNQNLTIGESSTSISLYTTEVEGETFYARGYILASIDLATYAKKVTDVFANTPKDYKFDALSLSSMNVVGDKLFVSGAFGEDLPFNDNVQITETETGLFVANVNTSDLNINNTAVFIENGKFEDTGTALINNTTYVSAINDKSSILFSSSDDKTASIIKNTLLNSIASNDTKLATVAISGEGDNAKLLVEFLDLGAGLSINDSEMNNLKLSVYPNPVSTTLHISEVCDITIYNTMGVLLKNVKNTDQLDVSHLTNGYYFALLKTENGQKTIPFIKK